ncbi:hypothetical protein BRC77_07115 [Halobacteriales archaeon QH_8_64_26]|nr:MAG: hypothetical protein BRC77_07115 [Halobacteriales archaeon QH_8_64_26]
MTDRATPRESLREEFTGLVVASLAVAPDVDSGRVPCRRCRGLSASAGAGDRDVEPTLGTGDRVSATLACYDNYSWEVLGVFCPAHAVRSVEADMGVSAEDQAVIEATLETTGYRSPLGEYYPNALTFGAVEILDFSPAADGY